MSDTTAFRSTFGAATDAGLTLIPSGPAACSQASSFSTPAPADPLVGGSYVPSATTTSGLPVAISIDSASTSGACSLSGSTVNFTGAGQCIVDANQPGNDIFLAAPQQQQSFSIAVPPDTIPPTAAPSQSPAANLAGWNNTNVTVTWNWTDNVGGSGIDPAHCTTTSTSSGEGANVVLTATCNDLAGNTGIATYTVKVDKTKPVLTVSPNVTVNATSPAGATVTYTAPTATDTGGSGVVAASVGCSPSSGTLFAIGTTTVNCTATDVAGNTQTGSFTVHVNSAAEQLSTLLTQVTGVGPGSSLADKVKQIQGYVAASDKADACSSLNAFINEVKARRAERSSPLRRATSFIGQAQSIEAVLGC